MKERIIELAEQAGIPIEIDWAGRPSTLVIKDGGTYLRGIDDLERFAELIVKETINEMIRQMWHHGIDESNNPSFYKAVDRTKEHFGGE